MMRLLLVPMLLTCFMSLPVNCIQADEILRTPQFMLISQYKCDTIFEANIQSKLCPQAVVIPERSATACGTVTRAHLLRDPLSLQPPKTIFLGAENMGRAVAFVEDVKLPPANSNNTLPSISRRTINFGGRAVMYLDGVYLYSEITASLYDTDSQMLYLLTRRGIRSTGPHCFVYFIKNIFSNDTSERIELSRFADFPVHVHNGARFDWTSDPYSNEAYYTTRQDGVTALHSLPMTRLVAVLKEGVHGSAVHARSGGLTRSHFRVSGGVLFSFEQNEDENKYGSYFRSLRHGGRGIFCESFFDGRASDLPAAAPMIVVRDSDYCLVRDGRSADMKACDEERRLWELEKGLITEEGTGIGVVLLVLAVIVLFTICILLCFCLCWMRKNLDESFEEELPCRVPYYPNHPGAYPYAGDMDVSVDRWN